ncbi:MAG: DUF2293 domain-containing protein [Desulfobacterales bacterium]|nr:DUF2293 domain-containing protein [Desulfobacterales bacterium]
MQSEARVVKPGKKEREVITEEGETLTVPDSWALLAPGDAALTRRVKQAGPHFQVQEKRGRKRFSRGVWAPLDAIEREKAKREAEKEDPSYQKRLEAGRRRRQKEEERYRLSFCEAVVHRLAFHPSHEALAKRLAHTITRYAIPVGSGTVARTRRISLEERADAAIIAWMRHHTTNYDNLKVARIKGERRRVRRQLAGESVALLKRYRQGERVDPCPIGSALEKMKGS